MRVVSRRALCAQALLAAAMAACAGDQRPVLKVSAAASLRDVLLELREPFESRHQARLQFNFAGSGVLAQQILAAPRADLFFSANIDWIDRLARAGRVVPGSRRDLCGNRLAVVGRGDCGVELDSPEQLAEADFEHLAIAQPDAVPAGQYARTWLESVSVGDTDLWQLLEPRLTPTLDVRAALALVRSSPRVLGIVYASDLRAAESVVALHTPPPERQPTIRYGAVRIVADGRSVEGRTGALASAFLDFASSEASHAVYRRHGFLEP